MIRREPTYDPFQDAWLTPSQQEPRGQRKSRWRWIIGAVVVMFAVLAFVHFGGSGEQASRAKAVIHVRDSTAWMESRLASRLGSPTQRATIDVCQRSTQIFNNTRWCRRTGYLLYPLDGLWTVPDASVFAALLNDGSTSPGHPCEDPWDGSSIVCLERNGMVRLQVNPFAQEPSGGKVPDYPGLPISSTAAWDGYDQLEAATRGHPCVAVAFTDPYFSG